MSGRLRPEARTRSQIDSAESGRVGWTLEEAPNDGGHDVRGARDDRGGRWWLFLLTGIAWFVFALVIFQWDYTTVYAISFLFGVVALMAGFNEFFQRALA